MKDKHPELGKSISETQKMLTVLSKNKETAKQSLEQFVLQLQRSRGNFFAVMRPRLKRLNPLKYLNRQELDKDLLYLHKALENGRLEKQESGIGTGMGTGSGTGTGTGNGNGNGTETVM